MSATRNRRPRLGRLRRPHCLPARGQTFGRWIAATIQDVQGLEAARQQSLATLIATPHGGQDPGHRNHGLVTLVVWVVGAPSFGLGKGVGGDHPEPDGFVGFDGQLGAALRDGVGDHFIMDGFTFDDAAQDRNPVKPFLEERGRQDRQLKSTWGGEFRKRQTASSGVVCLLRTLTEPVDDLGVPIGTHNGDTRGGWHGGQGVGVV